MSQPPLVATSPPGDAPDRTRASNYLLMVLALCLATFLVTSTGIVLAPFLLDLARDFEAELATVANLVALMSGAWGLGSLVAGWASDRVGRRPVLATGVVTLGIGLLGLSQSGTFPVAAAYQILAGLGGGAFMGTVFATVSDRVPSAERGRALGWVITGQSLSLVLGVPILTMIGSFTGWRGAVASQGVATLVMAMAVWAVVPPVAEQRTSRGASGASLGKLLNLRALALLGAGTMERACFASMGVYLATYLLTSYGVSLQELAVGLGLVALGNLGGNFVGSYLADRVPSRPLFFAVSSVATGLLALPLLLWQPGAWISIGLGFVYALANAIGRPALMATLSEVPSEVRGTLLGLNITCASFGWIGATAIGGWLITAHGFGTLGLFSMVTGMLGASLAVVAWWAGRGRHAG